MTSALGCYRAGIAGRKLAKSVWVMTFGRSLIILSAAAWDWWFHPDHKISRGSSRWHQHIDFCHDVFYIDIRLSGSDDLFGRRSTNGHLSSQYQFMFHHNIRAPGLDIWVTQAVDSKLGKTYGGNESWPLGFYSLNEDSSTRWILHILILLRIWVIIGHWHAGLLPFWFLYFAKIFDAFLPSRELS